MFFDKWIKKPKNALFEKNDIPQHIAIVMDGNGRWAKKRGLPRNIGHKEGANTLRKIVAESDKLGVKFLTVYAFSTENWNRPKAEVDALMDLLLNFLKNSEKEIGGKNIKIKVIGSKSKLTKEIITEIDRVTKSTANNSGLTLVIALNYGGRDEIVIAARKIAQDVANGKLKAENINEELFGNYIFSAGIPDPDIIIRPSGEMRISNFLLWQCAYSEFWYSDILWPDFSESDLRQAINDYQNRERRFGGV